MKDRATELSYKTVGAMVQASGMKYRSLKKWRDENDPRFIIITRGSAMTIKQVKQICKNHPEIAKKQVGKLTEHDIATMFGRAK